MPRSQGPARRAPGRVGAQGGVCRPEPEQGSRVWAGRNPGPEPPSPPATGRVCGHGAEHVELPARETYFFIYPYDLRSYGM